MRCDCGEKYKNCTCKFNKKLRHWETPFERKQRRKRERIRGGGDANEEDSE